ncbi:patatin family protein [Marinicrinis lubricantis]|uniref:Patatin family protein n=1 Tax=Marinicrinis lubricantis TaxID=2086470 RepID=A0ABW1ILU7_9BACL
MENVGLVLEGGGMKGVYTGGVLDWFMEQQIYFPYVIGVSAGACNASSYLSRQPGRNRKVSINYVNDPRYFSYRNLLREGGMFGISFLFDKLPKEMEPFDYDTFRSSNERFVVVTTDAYTGEPVYFEHQEVKRIDCDIMEAIKASMSLPFISKAVRIGDQLLFDGGVSDPIPVEKALQDGNQKVVVVLTKDESYRIKPFTKQRMAKMIYPKYKGLVQALIRRAEVYNRTMDLIQQLEQEGKVFVIRPSRKVEVGRIDKDQPKLEQLYEQGYEDAKSLSDQMLKWIHSSVAPVMSS